MLQRIFPSSTAKPRERGVRSSLEGFFLVLIIVAVSVALSSCGGGASGTTGGGPKPGTLILNVSPSAFTILPSSSITLEVTASESNTTATPTVTISGLPAGLTAGGTFPLTIPTGGTSITLQSAATIAAGTYSVMVNGQAGSATAAIPVNVTVQTQNLPAFYFTSALYKRSRNSGWRKLSNSG